MHFRRRALQYAPTSYLLSQQCIIFFRVRARGSSKDRVHAAPGAGRKFKHRRYPARFAIEYRAVPLEVLTEETVANLPAPAHFLFLMAGCVQSQLKTEQLSIVGLQAILHIIGVRFVIGKGHLKIEAEGVLAYLRVAILLIGLVNQHKHPKHLELEI